MSVNNMTLSVRQALGMNNELLQNTFCIASPSVTYKPTVSSSVDPFAGKTNKYAESKIIAITTLDKACHVLFGDSDIGAADTSDYAIPANTTQYFAVDTEKPYVRIIQNTASAIVFVTEIY